MALPRVNRLRHRQDFSLIYQRGMRRTSPNLTLRGIRQAKARPESSSVPRGPSPLRDTKQDPRRDLKDQAEGERDVAREALDSSPHPSKIGISVSQKVSKRSVVRNRVKRLIRAAIRQLLPSIAPGWLLVIVVHPKAVQCDYLQFLQELKQLLAEAEVLHER